MRRHIRLADLASLPTPAHETYTPAEMTAARAVMIERGLRYDNATGIIRDNRLGELERPSNPRDHVPHDTIADVMRWEFSRYIANSASRVRGGHSP